MQDNSQALEHFLASVERRAYRMAYFATSSSEEALDIVQDAMFGLVRKYASKPQEKWKPLFFKILQSKIRDWYRRNSVRNRWRVWLDNFKGTDDEDREDPISTAPDPDGENPEEQMIVSDSMKTLETALQTLSLRQQQAFLLRAWEGLSVSDTALAMQCSEGSVKTHYTRAVQTLRNKLEDNWP